METYDAIVLAGGRSRRLGGAPKHAVEVRGKTLLEHTLTAVADASRVIVAGDPEGLPGLDVFVVREDPPFGGPVAGIGAALPHVHADRVLVLACDHPFVAEAIAPLLAGLGADGAIAVDQDGRRQNLLFVTRTAALREAVGRYEALTDLAVHAVIESLQLDEIAVPARALFDVDTWEDRDELDAGGRHV